ncbi:DNA topoisomerase 3 [Methylacidiphilum caldifontis]|uniref:DNA topoisomerase n=1 Tax=Methylacidiphilum caldifontis TaxID=2795386 RepID=A0A4Y8P9M6_9BACT|nr:DNA topoisomerase 3 [Methylacidiphilum caldifontis]QSR89099.1 DNA topoisomerase 3 [Methylacidiphilum caldifontis]TFE67440.1 topoisomerase I [Methylacidiphilum caldifontis]
MAKTLVIAEKPSVAQDIADALGGFPKGRKDIYENDQMVISSAVGHVVELCLPAEMDSRHKQWSLSNLPILPVSFSLKPIEKSKARLNLLLSLLHRQDIDLIINACDAGREGELVFRYLIRYANVNKPIKRLWLQSMTKDAIIEAFKNLRPLSEVEGLARAAVSRSESDWLIGINGTRALTALHSHSKGFRLTSVGRVQTPTLAIVVEREKEILSFQPKPYWEIIGTFLSKQGEYKGKWFLKDSSEGEANHPERIEDEEQCQKIIEKCLNKEGIVTEEKKVSLQSPPLLYDLTTLQREANNRFGFSAQRTLQIAQSLYENHKLITYPRTDSKYLPEDYVLRVKEVLKSLSHSSFDSFSQEILSHNWVQPSNKIFNNQKVSDHFAIIPTTNRPSGIDKSEEKIYQLIVRRFLAAFYPPAQWDVTKRITVIEKENFKSEGKTLRSAGWLKVYRDIQSSENREEDLLCPIEQGERVLNKALEKIAKETKPPAHFTEATLLSAMESAGKLVEDETLREAMAKKGLGTPATRAGIIEGLIEDGYMRRHNGKELIATPKAFALIELLSAANIQTLRSAELTGEWEYKLQLMEKEKYPQEKFMEEIYQLTASIVDKAKSLGSINNLKKPLPIVSPQGSTIEETLYEYKSVDNAFHIKKYIAGRPLFPTELGTLIIQKEIGPLRGFYNKKGDPFNASLRLEDDKGTLRFVFEKNGAKEENEQIISKEPLGSCPLDNAPVVEAQGYYGCSNYFLADNNGNKCSFKINKTILGQEISREEMIKLLQEKKTSLLTHFQSKKKKKNFSAYIVLKDNGKLGFEFPVRKTKKEGVISEDKKGKKEKARPVKKNSRSKKTGSSRKSKK